MTNYRVVKITTNDFGQETTKTEEVIWEGTDVVGDLNSMYRRSSVYGADLLTHHEIEDGWIRFGFRFERQNPDGEWVKIDDPRPISTKKTRLEQEIDAENRRQYPGDYMEEEPWDYDDYFDDDDDEE